MKTWFETRRWRRGRGWAARSRVLELLEVRALLSAAPAEVLLIQVASDQAAKASLIPVAATDGLAVQPTGLPGVYQAAGDPGTLARLTGDLTGRPGIVGVEPEATFHVDATPDDPLYANGSLWGLNGANGINAPQAWGLSTGSTKTVVADIDTGMDYDHPDLYENVWLNQKEIPPSRLANLKDTDGDGLITFYDLNNPINQGPGKITDINGDGRIDAADILAPMQKDAGGNDTGLGGWADGISEDGDTAHVDDLVGWNFVNNTNNPLDDQGHGTHTAGTIGAMGNDGVGVVGVNWNVEIMPLKFLDASGSGTDVGAALAERYAADHGARVSNNSYGGGDGSQMLADAITYAATKNSIFVAAAGNSSANNDVSPNYPSNYLNDNLIAVAAIGQDGTLAGFSDYGATTVDIAAPGVNIASTLPNGNYGYESGTSMATPHVTGTVALVESLHPDWTYQHVISQILSTATPSANLKGKTVTGGILNAGAALAVTPAATASFLGSDTATQGNWEGAYGADGYEIAPGVNNAAAPELPAYATVALSASATPFTWSDSGADGPLFPQAPTGAGRVETAWYSATSFDIDVALTDGQAHRVSLYAVDWYGNTRNERIDVLDAGTGVVLDSRSISRFGGGVYLSWTLSGSVVLRVTNTGGPNAVVNALFFGSPAPVPTATASFLGSDTTTQGKWIGSYGQDGYEIAPGVNNAAAPELPAYATVSLSASAIPFTWNDSGANGPLFPLSPSGAGHAETAWYSATSFDIDVALTDGQAHRVSLYAVDWYGNTRNERIDVLDADTGVVLDSRSISRFGGGVYLSWTLSGSVVLRVTNTGGPNAVVNALFFGSQAPAPPPAPTATASFLGSDTATQGNWEGAYGQDGYEIAPGVSNAVAPALPSYATVSLSASAIPFTWSDSGADGPLFPQAPTGGGRVETAWYSPTSFDIDVALTDGQAHRVSLYAVDWYGNTRNERIDVLDAGTGKVLDSRSLSQFGGGVYLSWTLSGSVVLRVTNTGGPNAVVNALYFGSPPAAPANLLAADTTTQGDWAGAYGQDGYEIGGDAGSLLPHAPVAPSGQDVATRTSSTPDLRAIRESAAGSVDRVVAAWYA